MALFKAHQRFFDVHNEPQETLMPINGYEDMPLLSLKMSVENLERMISKAKENACIATERSVHPVDGLNQDESGAICLYTMNWKANDQSLSTQLNNTLRSNDRSELVPYFFYLKLLLTALWKLKSVKQTVWRGVKADLREQYPVGKIVIWWGFSSCVESIDYIQSDKFLGKTETRTLFQIECETGKAINAHSYYHDINEILLLPAIQLQVIDQTHSTNGLCIIRMKEIKSSLAFLQPPFTPSTKKVYSTSRNNSSGSLSYNSKIAKKTIKFYENKVLKELMIKERTSESIRFSKQLLNCDDMEMIANELILNKSWTMMYLWENFINEKHIAILMRGLERNSTVICLSLDSNSLDDEGAIILASALKTNTCLRTIYLNANRIGEIGGEELGNMLCVNRTLTHIEFSSNCIGDMGIAAISNALKLNNHLRTICLNNNKITDIGARYLADMLEVNRSLTDLQLSSNAIGDDGINVIVHALQQNIALESLDVSETMITVKSMYEIGKMLEMNTVLKNLYLNKNNLGDDALIRIISALMKNRTLTTLDLSMNNLTQRSSNELARLLKQTRTSLTTLIISQNPFGDIGITSIASALISNTTLTKLILDSVEMTIEGVRELAIMVCMNKTLRYLALNNNEINDNGMNLLADALEHNKTLQYLYLNNCNLKDDCVPLIVDIMEQSKTLISIELVKNQLTGQGKMVINEAAMLYKACSIYLDFSFRRVC